MHTALLKIHNFLSVHNKSFALALSLSLPPALALSCSLSLSLPLLLSLSFLYLVIWLFFFLSRFFLSLFLSRAQYSTPPLYKEIECECMFSSYRVVMCVVCFRCVSCIWLFGYANFDECIKRFFFCVQQTDVVHTICNSVSLSERRWSSWRRSRFAQYKATHKENPSKWSFSRKLQFFDFRISRDQGHPRHLRSQLLLWIRVWVDVSAQYSPST